MIDSIGHTPGQLSLYLEKYKVLFNNDLINIKRSQLKSSSVINFWDERKSRESFDKELKMTLIYISGGHGKQKNINYTQ